MKYGAVTAYALHPPRGSWNRGQLLPPCLQVLSGFASKHIEVNVVFYQSGRDRMNVLQLATVSVAMDIWPCWLRQIPGSGPLTAFGHLDLT